MSEDFCVYTALFGGYERLNEQPHASSSNARWICFTDDDSLTTDDWEVIVVEPSLPLDPIRSARRVKMLGHPALESYETTLWIDNSVVLDVPPEALTSGWLGDYDLAFPQHSYRATVLDEFQAVLDDLLDEPMRLTEQLEHYARTVPHILDERPLWTAIIARRCNLPVQLFMTRWWEQTLRYSRRDQLSVNRALADSTVRTAIMDIDNFTSEWHHWPVTAGRTRSKRNWDITSQPRPPMADLMLTKRQLAAMSARVGELESLATGLDSERAELLQALQTQKQQLVDAERVRRDADSLAQQLSNARASLDAAAVEARQYSERSAELMTQLQASEAARRELGQSLDEVRSQVSSMQSSRSWRALGRVSRLLGPLRKAAAHLGGRPASFG